MKSTRSYFVVALLLSASIAFTYLFVSDRLKSEFKAGSASKPELIAAPRQAETTKQASDGQNAASRTQGTVSLENTEGNTPPQINDEEEQVYFENSYQLNAAEIVGGLEHALANNDLDSFRVLGGLVADGEKMGAPCEECFQRIVAVLQNNDAALHFRVAAADILAKVGAMGVVDILLAEALKTYETYDPAILEEKGDIFTLLRYEIVTALSANLDSLEPVKEILNFLGGVSNDLPLPENGIPVDIREPLLETVRDFPDQSAITDHLLSVYVQTGSEYGKENILSLNSPQLYARLAILSENGGEYTERDQFIDAIYQKAPPNEAVEGMSIIASESGIPLDTLVAKTEFWSDTNVAQYSLEPFEKILQDDNASHKNKVMAIVAIGEALETPLSIQILQNALDQELNSEVRGYIQGQLDKLKEGLNVSGDS